MKTKSSKESWQSIRERYTWHLRPPVKKAFDRAHWWKTQHTVVDPVAALYELARRHPLVGLRMTRPWDGVLETLPISVIYLCDNGLKSWPKLTPGQKAIWKGFAGNLKGVDSRTDEEKCFDVAWQDEGEPLNQAAALKNGKVFTSAEIEAGIVRRAIEAYRQGHVLLAVAPGLAQDEAAALLAGKYGERRQFDKATHGAGKQRMRPKDWLRLVAQFDTVAASSGGANSRGFNSYRKAIDGLCF